MIIEITDKSVEKLFKIMAEQSAKEDKPIMRILDESSIVDAYLKMEIKDRINLYTDLTEKYHKELLDKYIENIIYSINTDIYFDSSYLDEVINDVIEATNAENGYEEE